MFPAQTSMMPVHVALARFLGQGGNILGDYPYWYLGTTPYRYLTGPIIPSLLVFFHKVFPMLSLFDLLLLLTATAWLVGTVAILLLVKQLEGSKEIAILSAIFYLFGPIVPFLFRFGSGVSLVAFSILPLSLLFYAKLLQKWNKKQVILCITTILLIILVDISIVPTLVLGMIIVLLSVSGWKKVEKRLKQIFLLIIVAVLLANIWYTPRFWWQLLVSPSFGGKPLFEVVNQLLKLLPISLALVLASISSQFARLKKPLSRFCFYWLFVFGFLTLIRFLSDPDFWLDWSAYGTEIQLGIALSLGLLAQSVVKKTTRAVVAVVIISWIGLSIVFFHRYTLGTLRKDITQSVEYKIGKELQGRVKGNEKVFLSGSTVFWLNAFFDIPQVRGGKDEVSLDPDWRAAAWEFREGSDVKDSSDWLRKLNVSYIVVHTPQSAEFYHDFKNPQKFEKTNQLEKVFQKNGDWLFKVK